MSDVKRDASAFMLPVIHNGRYEDIRYLLDKMSVPYEDRNKYWDWVTTRIEDNKLVLHEYSPRQNLVPNVYGMGAKDAVFILENIGLRVQINGRGKVDSQSITAGQRYNQGTTIVLNLR